MHEAQVLRVLDEAVRRYGVQGVAKRLDVSRAAVQSTLLRTGRIGTMALVEGRVRERLTPPPDNGGPRAA